MLEICQQRLLYQMKTGKSIHFFWEVFAFFCGLGCIYPQEALRGQGEYDFPSICAALNGIALPGR